MNELIELVKEMRKAQVRCKFGRAPSIFKARDAAEKKVDDHLKTFTEIELDNGNKAYVQIDK